MDDIIYFKKLKCNHITKSLGYAAVRFKIISEEQWGNPQRAFFAASSNRPSNVALPSAPTLIFMNHPFSMGDSLTLAGVSSNSYDTIWYDTDVERQRRD